MAPRITEIPATINISTPNKVVGSGSVRRTAGYARVSTLNEEQTNSYETQLEYYKNYIKGHEGWEFVGMYADEGISGTNIKNRKGFNKMIQDALDGKIDLIITKSVSRFARNTVDSLTTVRKLKDKGIEVYFEKENIWTLDSKGELLITIMSSLAQEESRSISENTAWGRRKLMAKGQVSVSYSTFLGYDKGPNGEFVINKEQAKIVERIYGLFLQGVSRNKIAKILESDNVPSPAGGKRWHTSTVHSILTNEKYKGDALSQKTYSYDFLNHKSRKNNGELKQYYIENHHEPIIERDTFDLVQIELKKIAENNKTGVFDPIGWKIRCEDCGWYFGKKIYHSNNPKLRKNVYRCNKKYDGDHKCKTPTISEAEVKEIFIEAFNRLAINKNEVVDNLNIMLETIDNREELDVKILEVKTRMSKLISDSAGGKKNESIKSSNAEYEDLRKECTKIEKEKRLKTERILRAKHFIENFEKTEGLIDEFDEILWGTLLDEMLIKIDGSVLVKFRGGIEIEIKRKLNKNVKSN